MRIIDDYNVVVSNDIELTEAITGNNSYSHIYFDQDITLTSGIRIPPSKANLIIDGTYLGIRHKYYDMNSTTATSTIYINSLTSGMPVMNVTMQNVDILGKNYYGIIYVYDSVYASNVTTTYKNVNYTGCQITYNNYGITEYIDSKIVIDNTTSTRQGEIGEVHKVVIGGNTTIDHTFTGYPGFYFRGGTSASFEILPEANVNITVARNLFSGDNILSSMIFGKNSTCNITTPNGLSFDINQRVRDVLIDEGASLNVYRTSASGNATLYVENNFTVNDGANVLIKSLVDSANPHLYFYTNGANLNINNPASCIFYNGGSSNFYFTETTNVNLRSYQINEWNTAPVIGDIYNMPDHQWIRKKKELIEFTGTATNSLTTISYNNLDPVQDNYLPDVGLFQLRTVRVLSFGYLPMLNVNRIINTVQTVSGTSLPNVGIRVEYKDETVYNTTEGNGSFSIELASELIIDDEVIVTSSNNNFLYNKDFVIIEEPGELSLYLVPDTMGFRFDNPISKNPCFFKRDKEGWMIQVYDSRVYSSNWKLMAMIEDDLICDSRYSLPESLIYMDTNESRSLSTTPILVFQGEDNGGVTKITDVKWPEDQGIILKIDKVPIYMNKTYKTEIIWILEE